MKKIIFTNIVLLLSINVFCQNSSFATFTGDRSSEIQYVTKWSNFMKEPIQATLSNDLDIIIEPVDKFKMKVSVVADNKHQPLDSSRISGGFEQYLSNQSSVYAAVEIYEYDFNKDGVMEIFIMDIYEGVFEFRAFRFDSDLKKYTEVKGIFASVPEIDFSENYIVFNKDEKYKYSKEKFIRIFE